MTNCASNVDVLTPPILFNVLEVYLEILFKSFDLKQIVKLFASQFDPQCDPPLKKQKNVQGICK
jgi:hypothetical protein